MAGLLPVPRFEVALAPPNLRPWQAGNSGVAGFTTRDSGVAGPHAVVVSLLHGNEFAGAVVVERLLREGFWPERGRLTLGFANLAAFWRFDAMEPTASRFLDEDLNRLWDARLLDSPRRSRELDRAREMRPLVETADALLDLHSMLWPSDPLLLCGMGARGRRLARAMGEPPLVVADRGHEAGPRLIDFGRFAGEGEAAACLVEAGQHWVEQTVAMTERAVRGFLGALGMVPGRAAASVAVAPATVPAVAGATVPAVAEVTVAVTAATSEFAFLQPYRGGEVIARRNTLIALDGEREIRTPHDDCLLVMPSLRPSRGHTAVRLARFVEGIA